MRITLTLALALFTHVAQAQLNVSAIFTDHAVIQRNEPIVVWGTASPGSVVSVAFGNETEEVVTGHEGRWRVTLEPRTASSSPQTLMVRSDGQTITRSDLLMGDVWHACGQSNMALKMKAVIKSIPDVQRRVETFDQPAIRFCKINEGPSRTVVNEFSLAQNWTVCGNDTVQWCSAVAFFFAAKVHAIQGVPLGVIDTSRGGTPIEPFIPLSAFDSHPTLQRERDLGEIDDLEGIARLPGGVRARSDAWLPGRLFYSRLAPLANYGVAGVIWYQGESNCGVQEDPRDYEHKMRALIRGWRSELRHPELPFYFVQLPGFGPGANWPYLREQQRLASGMVNSGMVVTIDLEHPDIHPPNKYDVGTRLANWALANQYGHSVPFSGPMFSKATVEGDQVKVEFDHAESGLMMARKSGLEPPVQQSDGTLNHFEITADGMTWHAANAVIVGKTVVVSSVEVDDPIAVRYAYSPAPMNCNLYNRDGLPASPFCSRPELLKGATK